MRRSVGVGFPSGMVRAMDARQDGGTLRRELGVFGAVMMGLGSIVGTGVFVSLGVAAGITGPSVVLAVAIGGLVATFNGLSSAQLAASHPVSGGTYEYGYRFLRPWLGFLAGWMFLLAKSASAATAALGFGGYLLGVLGVPGDRWLVPVALAAVLGLTGVVLAGIRRSNVANIAIVSITLASLAFFVVAGIPSWAEDAGANLRPFFDPEAGRTPWSAVLYASALMFVAYTGYGRIATLGEEVREPERTIPRAILATLASVMILYAAVAVVGVGAAGADALATLEHRVAPLQAASEGFGVPLAPHILAVGAITAMLGVLLNLVLGLSRVLLAMGRRRDMPAVFGRLDPTETTPTAAVIGVGAVIALLALIGDVRVTWSFSAFTVLVYYAITNAAALALGPAERLYPRWISAAGLIACVSLAAFVEWQVLLVGVGVAGIGLLWHALGRIRRS